MPHPRGSWWQQLGAGGSPLGGCKGTSWLLPRDWGSCHAPGPALAVLGCPTTALRVAPTKHPGTPCHPHPEPCWGWAPSCVLCKAGTSTAELDQDPAITSVPSTHPCPPSPCPQLPSGPCLSPPAPSAPEPVLPRAFDELFMRQVTSFVQIDFPPCHSNSIVLLEPHVRCCPVGTRQEPFASSGIISVNNNNNILNYISTFSVSIVIIKIKFLKHYFHCCLSSSLLVSLLIILVLLELLPPSCPPQDPGLCPP